jgi:hypothetical protein
MKNFTTSVLSIALLGVTLSACNSGASTETTAETTATSETATVQEAPADSTPAAPAPATSDLDACALVTKADAEEALGEPVNKIDPERAPAWPQCDYVPVDAAHRAAAKHLQIQAGIKGGRSQFDFDKKAFVDAKPVEGLGDAAFYSDPAGRTELSVVKGSQYFMIGVGLGEAGKEAAQLSAAKKLAAKVLERL